jgi:hypothetical protein
MYGSTTEPTPTDRKDKRALSIAIWAGVLLGLGHGIPRYGVFHVSTVNMVGIGVITTVALWAAIVALTPARKPQ